MQREHHDDYNGADNDNHHTHDNDHANYHYYAYNNHNTDYDCSGHNHDDGADNDNGQQHYDRQVATTAAFDGDEQHDHHGIRDHDDCLTAVSACHDNRDQDRDGQGSGQDQGDRQEAGRRARQARDTENRLQLHEMMFAVVAAAVLTAAASPPASLPAQSNVGTIIIPRIHLSAPLTMGSQQMYQQDVNWPSELNEGPAVYPKRCLDWLVFSNGRKECDKWLKPVLPWQKGTVALAGHRVTHTRPFRWVNLLKRGDIIKLRTHWGTFVYRVWAVKVEPSDSWKWVLKWGGPNSHTFVASACNPPGSAVNRIVVFAKRV